MTIRLGQFTTAASAAFIVVGAHGSVTTYAQFSNTSPQGWFQAATGIAGGYYDPGSFANWSSSSSTAGTAGYGWEFFTVTVANGTVSAVAGNLVFSSTASLNAMDVLFSFNYSGPLPPTGTQGIYGFGIDFTVNPASATAVGVVVNGAPVSAGAFANAFVGVIATTSSPPSPVNGPIQSVRFSFEAGSVVTVTGTQYAIVPGPATFALLGASTAILQGRRRRD
jgi:hypothetical protein